MIPDSWQVLDIIEKSTFFATLQFSIMPNLSSSGKIFQIMHIQFLLEWSEANTQNILKFGLQKWHQNIVVQTLEATFE